MLLSHLCLSLVLLPLSRVPAPEASRGDRLLDGYCRAQVKQIADACLADVKTRADWEKRRPELRRQFLEMMSLWPLPPRTDLKATVTGKVETDHFTVEKLHFQSIPGLYVTANLYLPKKVKGRAPAVLYVCGHAGTIIDGVSYGNRPNYQHHPAWFAEHGYVCLIVDTLQYGESRGLHHGTHNLGMWWWQALGYTPAGIECWNAIRALDYLEKRPEVDPKRIGVTGRSGGGATSWWVAAADDRPACIIPVAGIVDLEAHVVEGLIPRFRKGVISGHCDCMYFVNTYRWDFALVAALCAPRPLLLGNSDEDGIFPVPGYRRMAEKVRKVYELYGAEDRFALLETKGPHKDTPELRLGAFRWMNRWLRSDIGEVSEPVRPRLEPAQLKVFNRLPEDSINPIVHELFLRPARVPQPMVPEVARAWWPGKREELLAALKDKVFRGWPASPAPLRARPAGEVKHGGLRLRGLDFTSEQGVELRLWVLTAEKVAKPALVNVNVLDELGWGEWVRDLGPAFTKALQVPVKTEEDAATLERTRKTLEFTRWAIVLVAPRGIGPTRWSASGTKEDNHIRRRFALLGQTLDGQRVWDVRRGLAVLRGLPDLKGAPRWLEGKGNLAGVALYSALFEPEVKRLVLRDLPASHRQGPTLLNVLRVLDTPQAVALAFPRRVMLHVRNSAETAHWEWPLQLQRALGQEYLKIHAGGD
ncbi:MAG: prolyl oligopeptidase family serine peptidase [Gemmataceae bacterium]|nr:prolyl oligopeptidase family serine peptidase [Gemmataceae bacterium]